MRLLNVKNLRLTDFTNDKNPPRYVIASHRWVAEETTHQDVCKGQNTDRAGFRKVQAFARFVQEHITHIDWLWIDTCCIDKTNSAELSFAINSMFKWYRNAELCIAYLEDVNLLSQKSRPHEQPESNALVLDGDFAKSEWFKRGWTLQELLAPQVVVFVSRDWRVIGNKGASFHKYDKPFLGPDLSQQIAFATDLPERVLHDWAQAVNIALADKLTWMNGRSVTREEDLWYAMFGIVGVAPGANYGEGRDAAKHRLLNAVRQRDQMTTFSTDEYRKIKDWLAAPDPWTNHHAACKLREENTGTWLLDSMEYQQCKATATRHLWIHGKAGAGKTVLLSTVIEDLRVHCRNTVDVAQAVFYFSFSDHDKQSYEDLLRSLIVQLGWREPGLSTLRRAHDQADQRTLGPGDLLNLLFSCCGSYTTVFVLVDALDECPEVHGLRPRLLQQLYRLSSQIPNLSLVATSRDSPDIRLFAEKTGATRVRLDGDAIEKDISWYISMQISQRAKLSNLDCKTRVMIKDTLTGKADGSFRWVHCQLEQLNISRSTSPRAIEKALADLPATLGETYERMLVSIDEDDRIVAHTLLCWLMYARQPLTLRQLAEACIVLPGDDDLSEPGTTNLANRGGWRDALDLLAGLIVVLPSDMDDPFEADLVHGTHSDESASKIDDGIDFICPDSKIRLAHFSISEYLESRRPLSGYARAFHLSPAQGHRFLTQSCLEYLMYYSNAGEKTGTILDLCEFPLLQYAAETWWQHARLQQTGDTARELIFLTSWSYRCDWMTVDDPLSWASGPFDRDDPYRGAAGTALLCASFVGLQKVVQQMLAAGMDVNECDPVYGTALSAAAWEGHTEIVQLLLDLGADANVQAHHFGAALSAAVWANRTSVVQTLLAAGVDANVQDQHFGTVLATASWEGCEEIVRMLIDAGADVNAKDFHYGSALSAASWRGRIKIAQVLLEAGADVNAQDDRFGNALQAASRGGHKELEQMLLNRGADTTLTHDFQGKITYKPIRGNQIDTEQILSILKMADPRNVERLFGLEESGDSTRLVD